MKKIRWGVIGAGGIADRRTIPGMMLAQNAELVAVMDKVPAAAKAVGEKYNVPYYSDEEEMLKATSAEAVYISTPVFCHYKQAMLALSYGKHVFLEKPIGLDGKESRRLVEAFKAADKQLSIGYMMKYHTLHEKAKELIKAVAQAAENIDEQQATRLQGVIQGYAMAIKDQKHEEEKAS